MKNIFTKTKEIINRNNEITLLKQEHFNIFSILNLDYKEVKLHSTFISELLNPQGEHKLKTTFLNLFLKTIGLNSFSTQNISVLKEKRIKDGRVDIYIENEEKKDVIIIENKILADDQENQLCRYYKHKETKGDNSYLIYLTLYGKGASEQSLMCKEGEAINEKDYLRISYKDDIVKWLELCIKETYNFPILRETIKQYLLLIKKITNQLNNTIMEKELFELISENYNEAKLIATNISKVEENEMFKLFIEIKDELKNKLSNDWLINMSESFSENYSGLSISHNKWNKNISIRFEGQPKIGNKSNIFGFTGNSVNQEKYRQLLDTLNISDFNKQTKWWLKYKKKDIDINKIFNKSGRKRIKDEIIKMYTDLAKKSEEILKE
jgi:hypothetical protein